VTPLLHPVSSLITPKEDVLSNTALRVAEANVAVLTVHLAANVVELFAQKDCGLANDSIFPLRVHDVAVRALGDHTGNISVYLDIILMTIRVIYLLTWISSW